MRGLNDGIHGLKQVPVLRGQVNLSWHPLALAAGFSAGPDGATTLDRKATLP
jgi:hypothetical protein